MAGREIYDIPQVEKKILEDRARRRTALRREYLMQIHNPYRHALGVGGTVEDTAINRFMAMRATANEFFKPTWKNGLFKLASTIIPIVVVTYIIKQQRDHKLHLLSTGQVSYRDREEKFI